MWFLQSLLTRFPNTLLLSTLVLATATLPAKSVELTVLTLDNFEDTIAKGVWFIEHTSPYCGHCRRFLSTWERLVEDNQKSADPGIHLAQVNCVVDGDLCNQNGVNSYPQMNLYRDGQFVETFRQSREYNLLAEYLVKHAEPTSQTVADTVQSTGTAEQTNQVHQQDGKTEYTGGRKIGQSIAFAEKTTGPLIHEAQPTELQKIATETPVSDLFLQPPSDTKSLVVQ